MLDLSATLAPPIVFAQLGEFSVSRWWEDVSGLFSDLAEPPPFHFPALFKCVPVDNPLFLAAWLYLSTVLLLLFYFGSRLRPRQRIQFFIPDYWAATLCLLPAFVLLAESVNFDNPVFDPQRALLIAVTVHAIVAGVWSGLVLACPLKDEPLPRHGRHFVAVLCGGCLGLMAMFYFALYFHIVTSGAVLVPEIVKALALFAYGFIELCYLYPPLLGPTFFALFVAKKMDDVC